ncbi:MAG: PKD domain-containing protein [Bacteroidia bacterium]|nr:PKD domain-containing protein [Bacteroidia bacterium]
MFYKHRINIYPQLLFLVLAILFLSACGNKKPVVDFTAVPSTVKLGEEITFTDNSTNANRYLWNFGDGITRNDNRKQKYAYSVPGNYTAVLTVWNKREKDEASNTKTITVEAPTKDDIMGVWYYYFIQDVKQWESFTDKSTAINEARTNQVYVFDRRDFNAADADTFSLDINNYGSNILNWLWELSGGDLILKDTLNHVEYKYNIVKMFNDEMILRDRKEEGFDRLFYFKR